MFVGGAVVLVAALRGREFGNLGSTPDMWLVKGRIDGNDASLARMRAYLVHHYANRIAVSIDSNEAKYHLLNTGKVLGLVGVDGTYRAGDLTAPHRCRAGSKLFLRRA